MLTIVRQAVEAPESQPFEFTLDAWWVVIITSVLIPIVVGILTKAGASSWVKGLVNIVLTGIATVIAANMNDNGQAVFSKETIMVWAIATVISVASYLGIWQNLPVSKEGASGINAVTLPKVGLG